VNHVERRQQILQVLYRQRSETVANLARMFNVSVRTIKYDIEELTLSHPLETVRGRYGGGIRLSDWYHPTRNSLCPKQMALLKKLAPSLKDDDLSVMNSIISQFAP
jgi:DeoR/GlpR family transcriptional regulator of sugar metabolism